MSEQFEDEKDKEFEADKKAGYYQPDLNPDSVEEANRKSGLAYGAAMALVGSILFCLLVGWALDNWLETSPWLLGAGVILGCIIGLYQFIQITSKIN
jgi:F0F1-type ATP synthase assembly protein I